MGSREAVAPPDWLLEPLRVGSPSSRPIWDSVAVVRAYSFRYTRVRGGIMDLVKSLWVLEWLDIHVHHHP